jgi:SAM-dependent methyltransferase
MLEILSCPICDGTCIPLDVVDFNKSCEEIRGKFLRLSGISIYYYICNQCGFCFAPEFSKWELKDFEEKIYNEDYIEVDPDYKKLRPEANAKNLVNMFRGKEAEIQHLDYGGGNGLLSNILRGSGWRSSTYDPFVNRGIDLTVLGRFNLITAFEVFEHVPDVNKLFSQLKSLLEGEGIILFSTLLSDGNIMHNQRINWWYASPRNGHISLFSKNSLNVFARKHSFFVGSFNSGFHVLGRQIPQWASHIIKIG